MRIAPSREHSIVCVIPDYKGTSIGSHFSVINRSIRGGFEYMGRSGAEL